MSELLTSQPTTVPSQLWSSKINDPLCLNTSAWQLAMTESILIYRVSSFIKPATPSEAS